MSRRFSRLRGVVLAVCPLLVVGCGDDDSSPGQGGGGGAGGATGSTTTDAVASTTTTTTATTSVTAAAGTSVVSSGTGATTCEETADGDCTACVDCALEAECQPLYDAFFMNPDAEAFGDCARDPGCQGDLGVDGCYDHCADLHPEGAALTEAYFDCVTCVHCPTACRDAWDCGSGP